MPKIDMNKIRFITLYTGEKGPAECVCNCPCCSEGARKSNIYQGTELQIDELFEGFPNLEQLYILGNPDPAVDTKYCNLISKKAIKKNIHVCFSMSGVGGVEMLKQLLKGINPKMVDYLSFSIDSVNPQKMSMLKGINYPFEKTIEAIDWAIGSGYIVKIQPTLWSSNYMEASKIIDFFVLKGIKWFSFHIGSLESGVNLSTHKHLELYEVKEVIEKISLKVKEYPDIKVRCPIIYSELGENDESKFYCMSPESCEELLIRFTKNGIWCTNQPIISKLAEGTNFMLKEANDIVKIDGKKDSCPFSKQLSGKENTLCRFVSKTWNY